MREQITTEFNKFKLENKKLLLINFITNILGIIGLLSFIVCLLFLMSVVFFYEICLFSDFPFKNYNDIFNFSKPYLLILLHGLGFFVLYFQVQQMVCSRLKKYSIIPENAVSLEFYPCLTDYFKGDKVVNLKAYNWESDHLLEIVEIDYNQNGLLLSNQQKYSFLEASQHLKVIKG